MMSDTSVAKTPIGIFDSGYGGLTILHQIRQAMPEYDYSYSYPENGKPMAYTRFVYRDAIFELLFKTLAK